MSFRARIAAALVAASGVLCAAQVAGAEESGSFSLVASYVHDYTTVEHGGKTFVGGSLRGTNTVVESDGGPFVAGAISVTACVVYARTSDAGMDLDAPCTNTDSSGDRWFSLSKRTVGDTAVGGGGKGRMELLGGAGKYAGVTGSCTYTTRYLADNLVASQKNCTWRRP